MKVGYDGIDIIARMHQNCVENLGVETLLYSNRLEDRGRGVSVILNKELRAHFMKPTFV